MNKFSVYYNDNISIISIDHLKIDSLLKFMNKDIDQILDLERIFYIIEKKIMSFYFEINKIMKENNIDKINHKNLIDL